MALRRGDFQCAVCDLIFASDTAFQAHRTGPWTSRRCLTPSEIANARRKDDTLRFERDEFGRVREVRNVAAPATVPVCP